jgi:hypothetical protein
VDTPLDLTNIALLRLTSAGVADAAEPLIANSAGIDCAAAVIVLLSYHQGRTLMSRRDMRQSVRIAGQPGQTSIEAMIAIVNSSPVLDNRPLLDPANWLTALRKRNPAVTIHHHYRSNCYLRYPLLVFRCIHTIIQ